MRIRPAGVDDSKPVTGGDVSQRARPTLDDGVGDSGGQTQPRPETGDPLDDPVTDPGGLERDGDAEHV